MFDYELIIRNSETRITIRIWTLKSELSNEMSRETLQMIKKPGWTFLSNHAHVLICLALDPDMVLREVALQVGITERAVQKIVADLEEAGALSRQREGRRNHYRINRKMRLRHPLENHAEIGQLLELVDIVDD